MGLSRKQWILFSSLYIGYFMLICVRKSFSYASPVIMEEERIEKDKLGLIISSQMIGYSISKFFSGVLVDSFSPSKMLFFCLLLTGVTGGLFTFFDSVPMYSLIWFMNGFVQGPSWPACAVLLKRWFPADQFGTWWSALSSAINLSGTIGPVCTATAISLIGWRNAMSCAGLISVIISLFVLINISDHPDSRNTDQSTSKSNRKTAEKSGKKISMLLELLKEPMFVGVCVNYLFISLIRGASNDWGQLYLIQEKHQSKLLGSVFTSSQEIGGILGTLTAGYLSDYLVSKGITQYNPRLRVALWLVSISAVSIYMLLYLIDSSSYQITTSATGFGIGFGVYGVIALFGVTAMEIAPKGLEGTAHSIASLSANIGYVLAGYPMSSIANMYTWHAAFHLVLATSLCSVFLAYICQRQKIKKEA